MNQLSKIKSERLRKLMSESIRFLNMKEDAKQKILNEISLFSKENQEKIYCPFFENKNKEEENLMKKSSNAFENLLIKVKEADKYIKSLTLTGTENIQETGEILKEKQLLKQLEES